MTRQGLVTVALSFAVVGMPLSGAAWAQGRTSNGETTGTAVPRGGDGGGSAAPRGGDSGGSSGGSSSSGGSGASGGGMESGWTPSSPTPGSSVMSSFEAPRRSDEQSTRSRGGSSSTGTAAPRGGSSTSTRSGGNTSSGRSAASGSNDSGPSRRAVPAYSRPRDGRPVTGEVAERGSVPPAGGGGGGYYPIYPDYPYYPYYPWGFWGAGYGFGLGYLYYDPFFGGYGYGYGSAGTGGYAVSQSYRDEGSLRLKINPKHAQVYIDGFYVGVVDDYDGAFQKLGLEGGGHRVELKADGYEPLQFEVLVTPGETATYKGEMKRIQ